MSNLTKKISSVVLSATTAIWLSGSAMLIPVAYAKSTSDLQAQINALLAQITALQAQLASSQGPSSSVSCNFTRDLTVGSKGDDVKCLQQYLNGSGYPVAASGVGSAGNETTYFGSLTAAAAAKWQAANGVTPSVGYFGSKSRAKYASLAAASPTPSPSPAPAPTPGVGSGLTATLASDQPAPGLFGESFSSRPFTKLVLTASVDGDVTVKSLTVERTGQGNDAAFSGVIAVDEDGIRIGDSKTFGSDHRLRLTGAFNVKAGQSRTITLAGDSDADQNDYQGQRVSLSLVGVETNGASVNASFPLVGNYMDVNSTLSIGSVTLDVGALDPRQNITKEIGTAGYTFSALKLTAGTNEDILFKSISWNQSGSAAVADLTNVKVYLDGVPYDTKVSSDGKYFTASFGSGVKIEKGLNKEVWVKGDIASGSNRTADFDLYRYADAQVVGLTYNYGILPSATETSDANDDDNDFQSSRPSYDASQVTIGAGSMTVEQSTTVTAQNIAENLADQPLGGFLVDVKGEPISVAAMNFDVSTIEAAGTGGSIDTNDITSIKLIDPNGNVVAGPVDGLVGGNNAIRITDTVIFPVGRSVYLLKGKLGTDFSQNDQIAASTTPSSDWTTVRGQNTSQTITPGGGTVTMSTMTMKTGSLTLSLSTNTASSSPDQNIVRGTSAYPFANYILNASESGEDLRITSMQLDLTTSYPANTADELTNCSLFDGATALNTGTNIVNPTNAQTDGSDHTFTFDASLIIPKGTQKSLTLKCNLTAGGTAEYVGWGAGGLTTAANAVVVTGVTSGTTVAETVTTDLGRTIVPQTAGTLTLALDPSSPSLKLIQAGATDQTLAIFRLDALYEDIRLNEIGLQLATSTASGDQANASNSPSDLTKVTLWDGATKVGEVLFTNDYATATLSNFVILKNAQKLLTVKADIAPVDVTLSQAVSGHLINVDWDGGWGDAPDDDAAEGEQGFKGTGQSSGQTVYNGSDDDVVDTDTASNGGRIVKAIPTLTKLSTSGKFTNTSDQVLYRMKIEAPAGTNGVGLYKFSFNISTTTTAVLDYGGTASEVDDAVFKVTNYRMYCYSDAGFSLASCGSSTGQLNQFGLVVADGNAANTDFEEGVTTADPDADFFITFNPTATSGATADAIRIPSGETRWFELKADVTGASSTPSISTKLLGDDAWQSSICRTDADSTTNSGNSVVSACDYTANTTTANTNGAAAFTSTASVLDADAGAAEDDFIWSDNATNTSQSIASWDWLNGFLVPGVPTVSTGAEVLTF